LAALDAKESRSFSPFKRSSSASRSLTCASLKAFFSASPFSSRQASTSASTTPSFGSSSEVRAAISRPSVVCASLTSSRFSKVRSSSAAEVSGGICSCMAVRKAPQAAGSWEILRTIPLSNGAPPDLRVRASACMPLGSRTSSRPGTFLQSSARARLVSSLPRRRRSNSSGRSCGGILLSRGSSASFSGVPASVSASLGMGSDTATPSTNMNVIWCLHVQRILSRHFDGPASFSRVLAWTRLQAISVQHPAKKLKAWLEPETAVNCPHGGQPNAR
jgi:hypothetical protein